MIYFRSDYTQGAHPKVLDALLATNLEHTDGYGLDSHCQNATEMIKALIGFKDCAVHMMMGGTSCNITVIATALRPYEAVISARTGHIYSHESGGVEATGHRIITQEGVNGKLTPALIDRAFEEYEDEHTVVPKMVYLSQPTEIGSIYSKAEMKALSEKCKERNLYLYVDGARLGCALTCKENDLTIKDLAALCDAFYIGGTKNGALFGEALVMINGEMNDHFRYMMKRQCSMLAKGRLLGVQFEALLEGGEGSVYFEMARHANEMADLLRKGLQKMNINVLSASPTNQLFPILPSDVVLELEKEFSFYRWAPEREGKIPVRFVTAWGTEKADVDALLSKIHLLMEKTK